MRAWGILLLASLTATVAEAKDVRVKPYFRKDGTFVQGHVRTAPNSSTADNWSTKGNVNPYTGKPGTVTQGASLPPLALVPQQPIPPAQGQAKPSTSAGDAFSEMYSSWVAAKEKEKPDFIFLGEEGTFTAHRADVRSKKYPITVWLRGDHRNNAKIAYRSSLWHIRTYCDGQVSIDAATTYRADGSIIDNWDSAQRPFTARPGTVYEHLEKWLCTP